MPTFIAVVGFLWGAFVGLLPFAVLAMIILAQFDPKRKDGEA